MERENEYNLPVLNERTRVIDRDLQEVKQDHKEFRGKMERRLDKLEEEVDKVYQFNRELKINFENFVKSHDEVKKKIDKIATDISKDKGWRGFLIEALKVIVVITAALLGVNIPKIF